MFVTVSIPYSTADQRSKFILARLIGTAGTLNELNGDYC